MLQSLKANNWLNIIILLAGIFMLSTSAVLIRLGEQQITPTGIIFNRLWISTIVLWLVKQFSQKTGKPTDFQSDIKHDYKLSYYDFGRLSLIGILYASCLIIWAISLTKTSVTNSNLLHNLTPLFTIFGGAFFLQQNFDRRFLAGAFIAFLGSMVIGWEDFNLNMAVLHGDILALISAIFYAAHLILSEQLRNKISTINLVFWEHLFATIVILGISVFINEGLFPNSLSGWLVVVILAVFPSVVGYSIITYYLGYFSSQFISLFLLLEPLFTAFLARLVFSEVLSILNYLAFLIVIIGIFVAQSALTAGVQSKPVGG